ncbi:hypothetical protein Tco_0993520, partial [Tanacetum coccineum]
GIRWLSYATEQKELEHNKRDEDERTERQRIERERDERDERERKERERIKQEHIKREENERKEREHHYNIYHYLQRQIRRFSGDLALGMLFPGDMSPGISRTEKLEGDTFPSDLGPT